MPGGSKLRTRARASSTSSRVYCRSSASPMVEDLFGRRHQEAVGVQVADDQLGDLALASFDVRHVELPEEVVVEVGLAGEAVLDRRLVPLLHHRGVAGALPVVAEVGVEVDVLHRLRVIELLAVGRLRDALPPRGGTSSSMTSLLSSSTGFSTSSWVRSVSSSMRVICRSLIACWREGVITSFWASLRESFCSNAIRNPLYRLKSSPR